MVARFQANSFHGTTESELEFLVFALVFALFNVQGSSVWRSRNDWELVVEWVQRWSWGCGGNVLACRTDVNGTHNILGAGVGVPLLQTSGGAGLGKVQLERSIGGLIASNGGSAEEADDDVFLLVQVGLVASELEANQRWALGWEEVGIHDIASPRLSFSAISRGENCNGINVGANRVVNWGESIAHQDGLKTSISLLLGCS